MTYLIMGSVPYSLHVNHKMRILALFFEIAIDTRDIYYGLIELCVTHVHCLGGLGQIEFTRSVDSHLCLYCWRRATIAVVRPQLDYPNVTPSLLRCTLGKL